MRTLRRVRPFDLDGIDQVPCPTSNSTNQRAMTNPAFIGISPANRTPRQESNLRPTLQESAAPSTEPRRWGMVRIVVRDSPAPSPGHPEASASAFTSAIWGFGRMVSIHQASKTRLPQAVTQREHHRHASVPATAVRRVCSCGSSDAICSTASVTVVVSCSAQATT